DGAGAGGEGIEGEVDDAGGAVDDGGVDHAAKLARGWHVEGPGRAGNLKRRQTNPDRVFLFHRLGGQRDGFGDAVFKTERAVVGVDGCSKGMQALNPAVASSFSSY